MLKLSFNEEKSICHSIEKYILKPILLLIWKSWLTLKMERWNETIWIHNHLKDFQTTKLNRMIQNLWRNILSYTDILKLNLQETCGEEIKYKNLTHFHKGYQKGFNKLDKVFADEKRWCYLWWSSRN